MFHVEHTLWKGTGQQALFFGASYFGKKGSLAVAPAFSAFQSVEPEIAAVTTYHSERAVVDEGRV
jgi:hypothetical protein